VQVANESPYDPVVEYLDRVAATVAPAYIEALSTGYLRPSDTPGTIYDEMLKRTLIGAVARAYNPGCKHDTACVIMGDQGAYKSSFWACLGHDFFSDALGDISSKDDLMVLHRSWIMEWAELDHVTNRKHAGQVKAFLSQAVDMFRVPYGKATEAFPRRGIIVGTTNRTTGFLVDETGNRRFWVIPTTKTQADQIDTAALLLERDAIWSAAVAAYRAGETSRLPMQYEQQLSSENESYVVDNPWQAEIEAWLRRHGEIDLTTEKLLTEAIKKPVERQTKADQMQVADVLKRLGYKRYRSGKGSSRAYVYRK
jgi:predicted P-loop ATPase